MRRPRRGRRAATAANHLPSAPRPIPPCLPPPHRLPPPSQAPPRVLASAVAELARAGPVQLPIGGREWGPHGEPPLPHAVRERGHGRHGRERAPLGRQGHARELLELHGGGGGARGGAGELQLHDAKAVRAGAGATCALRGRAAKAEARAAAGHGGGPHGTGRGGRGRARRLLPAAMGGAAWPSPAPSGPRMAPTAEREDHGCGDGSSFADRGGGASGGGAPPSRIEAAALRAEVVALRIEAAPPQRRPPTPPRADPAGESEHEGEKGASQRGGQRPRWIGRGGPRQSTLVRCILDLK